MCCGLRCHTAEWGKMPHSNITLRQGIFNSIQFISFQNVFPLNKSLSASIRIEQSPNSDEMQILPLWASFGIMMVYVASYPFCGVRCHGEDQICILIFFGKYEQVTPKLNWTCCFTPIPVTNHTENKHNTAWSLVICNFHLEGASYPTLP